MRFSRHDRIAAVLLLLLLAARVAFAAAVAPPLVSDAQAYDVAAQRLIKVGTYAYPLQSRILWKHAGGDVVMREPLPAAYLSAPRNSWTMPGYPAFLAVVYRVFGTGSARWVYARIVQALLSVVSALIAYLIAKRFSAKVALTTLVMGAVYPPLTFANSYILTESLYVVVMLAFVRLFLRWQERRTPAWAAAAGAVFGATLWIRPVMALWIVGACVAVFVATREHRRRIAWQVAIMAVAAMLILAPWWARNYQLYGRFVTFGTYNSVNVAEAYRRDFSVRQPWPWSASGVHYTAQDRRIAAEVSKVMDGAPKVITDDAAVGAYYDAESPKLTRRLLQTYPGPLLAARARSLATSVVWPYAVSPSAMSGIPFRVALVVHLGLLVLFVVGAIVAPRRLDMLLLLSIPVYVVVFHALVLPLNRYMFPAAPIALMFSAAGFERLTRGRSRRSR